MTEVKRLWAVWQGLLTPFAGSAMSWAFLSLDWVADSR